MQLAKGTMVTPTVRLSRPLRQGGMGHVWLAEHIGLHVNVAVKFVADKLSLDDPAVRSSFEQEARAAARIKSQHVVQTHDCGIMADGTPYIVMELLEGESLQERLDRLGVLSLVDTAHVLFQVAKALAKAHRLGIVHRDIKPANIFLCRTDEGEVVKVLDFGLAQTVRRVDGPVAAGGELAQAGITGSSAADPSPNVLVGTLPFLPPEILAGDHGESPSADLWALAVVAYRCLVGRFPFAGNTPGLLCLSVMTGEFPLPSQIRADLPRGVDDWFVRAFHGEQGRRFASAKEMAAALAANVSDVYALGLLDDDSRNLSGYQAMAVRAAAAARVGSLESGPTVLPPAEPRGQRRTWIAAALGFALVAAGVAITVVVVVLGGGTEGAAPADSSRDVSASAETSAEGQAPSAEPTALAPPETEPTEDAGERADSTEGSPDGGSRSTTAPAEGTVPVQPAWRPKPGGQRGREDYGF